MNIDTNTVTLSLWVKLDYLPADMPGPYGPLYDSDSDNYVIYGDRGNNELRFKVTTASWWAERPGIPGSDLVVDEWLHIVGVYDGSHASIYLNGKLKDSHTLSGNIMANSGDIFLGRTGTTYFNGEIDNVQVYGRGLTEQEVAYLYSGSSVPSLSVNKVEEMTVSLSWQHQADPVQGISGYKIYRDTTVTASILIATVGDTAEYIDFTAQEFTNFYYRIKSVDAAGIESDYFSNEVMTTTGADVTPPEIVNVMTTGEANKVLIHFSEPVDSTLAENIANYAIDNSVVINSAKISAGNSNVMIDATGLVADVDFTITVNNITDMAQTPNTIVSNTQKTFKFYPYFDNLISYWPLDEGTDTVAVDITGNGNNAAIFNSPAWVDGVFGNALRFDGMDDYVEIPNSPLLNIDTNEVTLLFWVKLDYLPTEMPTSIGPIYDAPLDRYVIYEDKGNKELRFKVTTTNGAERPGIPEAYLKKGEWLHIVGVYDGSQAMIYLNGELMDAHTNLTGNVKADQIARLGQDGSHYFNGEIDNVQLYSRALSKDEVQFLYTGDNYPVSIRESETIPMEYALLQNYPNPFNPMTTMSYNITKKGKVTLSIYDVLGRKVIDLVNKVQNPGAYEIIWNGRNNNGNQVSSGIYFYRITAEEFTDIKKMILVR